VSLAEGVLTSSGVLLIRFANARDGWAFGPELWSTHDGGATWHQLPLGGPGAQIASVSSTSDAVYAVVTHCQPTGCAPAELDRASVGSDSFAPVSGLVLPGLLPGAALNLIGSTGYLSDSAPGSGQRFIWATTDGTHWLSRTDPCDAAGLVLASIAPIDAARAWFMCAPSGAASQAPKQLFLTTDAAQSYQSPPLQAPRGGEGGQLIAASPQTLGLATASGGTSRIDVSADGGHTWTVGFELADGGLGFGDFAFIDSLHGLAVHYPAQLYDLLAPAARRGPKEPATLLLTADGGHTWNLTPIR
jgi:photosystem II stability/assembly factor-like uncharacterized protein